METGYCLEKNLIDKSEILDIRHKIQSIFKNLECGSEPDMMRLFRDDFDAFIGCASLCQKLPEIYKLAGSLNDAVCRSGIDFPVLNTKPILAFSSKHTAKSEAYYRLGAHQDWASNLGSTNGVTCWIPLQDVDDDLGPLEVVPNSHLLGPLEHSGTPPLLVDNTGLNFISVPMALGDALFFNTMLVHRSGHNVTDDRIRISLHFRFNDANEPTFIQRKYPRNRTGD